jgi:hypothetical protein
LKQCSMLQPEIPNPRIHGKRKQKLQKCCLETHHLNKEGWAVTQTLSLFHRKALNSPVWDPICSALHRVVRDFCSQRSPPGAYWCQPKILPSVPNGLTTLVAPWLQSWYCMKPVLLLTMGRTNDMGLMCGRKGYRQRRVHGRHSNVIF